MCSTCSVLEALNIAKELNKQYCISHSFLSSRCSQLPTPPTFPAMKLRSEERQEWVFKLMHILAVMQLSVFHTGVRLHPSAPSHVSVPLMSAHISLSSLHCGFNGVLGKVLQFCVLFSSGVCKQFWLFAVNAGTWSVSLSLPVLCSRKQNSILKSS